MIYRKDQYIFHYHNKLLNLIIKEYFKLIPIILSQAIIQK